MQALKLGQIILKWIDHRRVPVGVHSELVGRAEAETRVIVGMGGRMAYDRTNALSGASQDRC